MADHQESVVVAQLKKKFDLDITGKQILELKRFPGEKGTPSKGDVGNKSRGKIDFLVKYCGYGHRYVSKFERSFTK
jgi:hypothetical protein